VKFSHVSDSSGDSLGKCVPTIPARDNAFVGRHHLTKMRGNLSARL